MALCSFFLKKRLMPVSASCWNSNDQSTVFWLNGDGARAVYMRKFISVLLSPVRSVPPKRNGLTLSAELPMRRHDWSQPESHCLLLHFGNSALRCENTSRRVRRPSAISDWPILIG